MRTLSIAIPSYNRFEMTIESFVKVLNVDEVREVVIVDDCSTDGSYERLIEYFKDEPKVKIFRNESNQDCYRNKREAVEKCTSDWVILLDSDNIIDFGYLHSLFQNLNWKKGTIYTPDFAADTFCFHQFSGLLVTKGNVARWIDEPLFSTMLNAANYFVNREEYLRVWDGSVDPVTSDSIFTTYNWLNAGNKIQVVDGLKYHHRIHPNGHYNNNVGRTPLGFHESLLNKLREMI